jgi:hypothetical protein
MRTLAIIPAFLLLGACASAGAFSQRCAGRDFEIDDDFERGAIAACRIDGKRKATVLVRPEAGATNDSAWYAFRVSPRGADRIAVTLAYQDGSHRYWPKLRRGDGEWRRAEAGDIAIAKDGASARLRLDLAEAPVFVAAQPLTTIDEAIGFATSTLSAAGFDARILGQSADGRPLYAFERVPAGAQRLVVILARQHPPETTGAVAFEAFIERLAASDARATAFRNRYALFIAPMVNPDGFARGHWRGNAAGADVNRDWGPFKTPEAAAFAKRIGELAAGRAPALFADFHSTKRNVIYAAPEKSDASGLADAAFARLQETLGEGAPEISRSHNSARTTAKAWSLETLRVAGFTYEVADEADLDEVRATARAFAEALLDAADRE